MLLIMLPIRVKVYLIQPCLGMTQWMEACSSCSSMFGECVHSYLSCYVLIYLYNSTFSDAFAVGHRYLHVVDLVPVHGSRAATISYNGFSYFGQFYVDVAYHGEYIYVY